MSFLERHIAIAAQIIEGFHFSQPFAIHLQTHFAAHKKYGSKDRKQIREACFGYFRTAGFFPELSTEEQIKKYFVYKNLIPADESETLQNRIKTKGDACIEIFPFYEQISSQIDALPFVLSHLENGKVFFRKTRPEKPIMLPEIAEQMAQNTFAVPPGFSLNTWHDTGQIQIQDLASQWACEQIQTGAKAWELCCGAGGKTLHLTQLNPHTAFYASDIREKILTTLQERIHKAGLKQPYMATIDLSSKPTALVFKKKGVAPIAPNLGYFSDIIADVPCTGSGVWRRNPEHLIGFKENKIAHYASLQRNIVGHALPYLQHNGKLHYITCSVYAEENEGQNDYFASLGLEKEAERYLNANLEGGDILYYSRWTKR